MMKHSGKGALGALDVVKKQGTSSVNRSRDQGKDSLQVLSNTSSSSKLPQRKLGKTMSSSIQLVTSSSKTGVGSAFRDTVNRNTDCGYMNEPKEKRKIIPGDASKQHKEQQRLSLQKGAVSFQTMYGSGSSKPRELELCVAHTTLPSIRTHGNEKAARSDDKIIRKRNSSEMDEFIDDNGISSAVANNPRNQSKRNSTGSFTPISPKQFYRNGDVENYKRNSRKKKKKIKPEVIDLASESDTERGDKVADIREGSVNVSKIYLGKKCYDRSSFGRELLRIEPSPSGIRLFLGDSISVNRVYLVNENNNISGILLKKNEIKQRFFQSVPYNDDGSETFYIAIEVEFPRILENASLTLEISIGNSLESTLNPAMEKNTLENPAKYILIVFHDVADFLHLRGILETMEFKGGDIEQEHLLADCADDNTKRRWLEEEQERKDMVANSREKRRSRRSRARFLASNKAPIGEQVGDSDTYLVYPIEEDAKDAIHITHGDIRRLEPPEYLNDQLIDFKIKHMMNEVYNNTRAENSVYAFNCLFYPKLTEEKKMEKGYPNIKRWTKNVDIFQKEMLIIPINQSTHWSVLFILFPNRLFAENEKGGGSEDDICDTQSDNEGASLTVEDLQVPCILCFDSSSIHNSKTLAEKIKVYLRMEYMDKKCRGMENSEIQEKIKKCVQEMKHITMNDIPIQENGYDCGVYVIKYIDTMLRECLQSSNELISDKFASLFRDHNCFTADEVTRERTQIKDILQTIKPQYDEIRGREEKGKQRVQDGKDSREEVCHSPSAEGQGKD